MSLCSALVGSYTLLCLWVCFAFRVICWRSRDRVACIACETRGETRVIFFKLRPSWQSSQGRGTGLCCKQSRPIFGRKKKIVEKVSGRDQARDRDRVSGSSETRVPSPPSSSSSSLAHPSPLVMFTRTTALAAAAAATVALTFGVSSASAQSIPATASAEELALVSAQFSNSGFNLSTVSCRERV